MKYKKIIIKEIKNINKIMIKINKKLFKITFENLKFHRLKL